jgi:Tfp pilus assembly protein PilX
MRLKMNAICGITNVQVPARKPADARGVALIFTLLILALLMVLSLGMVIALSSQTFIGGYYRNFRGAFYSSDSGLNIARQAMVNEILSLVPATTTLGSQPIPAGSDATVQTYINSTYNTWTSIGGGQATNSWPGQFELSASSPATFTSPVAPANCQLVAPPSGTPPPGGPYTCASPPPASSTCSTTAGLLTNCYSVQKFIYTYNYTLDVLGEVKGNEQSELAENGSVQITVNISPPSGVTTNASFAAWGMFIDQYNLCDGSTLVPGTISGPVFTNGAWNFGTGGKYIFTDAVGSHNADAGYQFSSGCAPIAGPSDTSGGTTIAPTFQNGFLLGQPSIPLPSNSFNQLEAVLDGMGCAGISGCPAGIAIPGTATAEHAVFNTILKDANGVAYPTGSAATAGVYLPYYMVGAVPTLGTPAGAEGAGSAATTCAGGIFVEGDATVTVAPLGGSTTAQVYTIVQGGTTTTVTINPTTNQTIIKKGAGAPKTITGVPENCSPGTATTPATMLYVNGNITGLAGPESAGASSGPAIQNGTELTITASSNITITGDIRYVTEPVTFTQNQIPGTPPDTLIPGNNYNQVLGIFTANGNINLANSQSSGNLEIDGSVAMISSGGSGGLVNTGSAINTLNIVGGRIQNTIQNINTTTRNVFFDRRFAANNFAPPWFPSTTVTTVPTGVESSTAAAPTIARVQWVCKSCQ